MINNTRWQVLFVLVVFLVMSVATAVADRKTTQTKEFKVKKGGTLIVDAEDVSADIEIRVWNKSVVNVRVDGVPEEDIEDLEMSASGNTVRVEYFGGGRRWRSQHVDIMIDVPNEFNLELSTSGGDIEVSNPISGTVEARTSGGDIELDSVDGEVDVATSGGDVTVRDVLSDAELRTSGGDIECGDVKGRLMAHTSGGDITIGKVDNDLEAKTAGGDIEVGDVGGYAEVSTAGGDVRLGKVSGTADVRTAGGDIELMSASGRVSAQTAGGDIVLEDISGSIEAETAGGDIVVELTPSGNRGSHFETAGGDIELMIAEGAKVNIEAEIRIHNRWGWGKHDDEDYDEYEIYSDFDAKRHEKTRRGIIAEYVLNGGGKTITLETTNGDIQIRKLRR